MKISEVIDSKIQSELESQLQPKPQQSESESKMYGWPEPLPEPNVKLKSENGQVKFIMETGKHFVLSTMPIENVENLKPKYSNAMELKHSNYLLRSGCFYFETEVVNDGGE
jgi:hypothetical protein